MLNKKLLKGYKTPDISTDRAEFKCKRQKKPSGTWQAFGLENRIKTNLNFY
jgi:hypothetical protein